jgi:hypothetical protein
LGVVLAFAWAVGCERSPQAARAVIAERRAGWTREIGGMKEQLAALVARADGHHEGAPGGPAEQRTRVVLAAAQQSIGDVERQLAQAAERTDQSVRLGGEAAQRAIDDESARSRGYLQALGQVLGSAGRQLDGLARSENGTKSDSR